MEICYNLPEFLSPKFGLLFFFSQIALDVEVIDGEASRSSTVNVNHFHFPCSIL